jgi:hypothetical protein
MEDQIMTDSHPEETKEQTMNSIPFSDLRDFFLQVPPKQLETLLVKSRPILIQAINMNLLGNRLLPELKKGNLEFFGTSLPLINYSLANSLNIDFDEELLDSLFEHITTVFNEFEQKL